MNLSYVHIVLLLSILFCKNNYIYSQQNLSGSNPSKPSGQGSGVTQSPNIRPSSNPSNPGTNTSSNPNNGSTGGGTNPTSVGGRTNASQSQTGISQPTSGTKTGGTATTPSSGGGSAGTKSGEFGGGVTASNPSGGTEGTQGVGAGTEVTKKGIELKVDKGRGSSEYDRQEDKKSKTTTFTPKGNNAFKTVKHGNTKIWETSDPNEYATKVVKEDENKVTIYMGDGTKKVYKRSDKRGGCTFCCFITCGLSRCCGSGCDSGNTRTWEEDDSYKKVENTKNEGNNSTSVGGSTNTSQSQTGISQPTSGTKTGGQSGISQPTSGIVGGTATTPPSGGGSAGSQGGESDMVEVDKSKHPKNIKISIEGSSEENDSTKYEVKKYGDEFEFKFKSDANCSLVKYEGKELWKYGDHNCTKYPTDLSYNGNDEIVVYFDQGFIRYKKDTNGNWNVQEVWRQ